jgi:hypothetical protein
LPIVNGRDVWSWLGRKQGKRIPAPSGIGRQRPAKQNQSSPAFVNFHFDFGDFVPVNSKKCEDGYNNFVPLAAIDMTITLGPPGSPVAQVDITSSRSAVQRR